MASFLPRGCWYGGACYRCGFRRRRTTFPTRLCFFRPWPLPEHGDLAMPVLQKRGGQREVHGHKHHLILVVGREDGGAAVLCPESSAVVVLTKSLDWALIWHWLQNFSNARGARLILYAP